MHKKVLDAERQITISLLKMSGRNIKFSAGRNIETIVSSLHKSPCHVSAMEKMNDNERERKKERKKEKAFSRTLAASSKGSMKPKPFFALNLNQTKTLA